MTRHHDSCSVASDACAAPSLLSSAQPAPSPRVLPNHLIASSHPTRCWLLLPAAARLRGPPGTCVGITVLRNCSGAERGVSGDAAQDRLVEAGSGGERQRVTSGDEDSRHRREKRLCKVVLQRCIDLVEGHSVSAPALGEPKACETQGVATPPPLKTTYSVLRPQAQLHPSHGMAATAPSGACLHARGASTGRDGKDGRNRS